MTEPTEGYQVMTWVAADRSSPRIATARAVESCGLPGPVDRWRRLRAEVRADVLRHGFDERRGTFVQSYGSDELDGSLLLIPRVGFLPGDDRRVLGTIDAVQRELASGGLVLRYRAGGDGLPGGEGVFLACSFWLVDALYGAGRRAEAVDLFERLLSLRNDVGLLAEEWDPATGRQLGSPQALSHLALIESAAQLAGSAPAPGS